MNPSPPPQDDTAALAQELYSWPETKSGHFLARKAAEHITTQASRIILEIYARTFRVQGGRYAYQANAVRRCKSIVSAIGHPPISLPTPAAAVRR